eukprot:9195709-Ditylum_brightwellii.AAC.1
MLSLLESNTRWMTLQPARHVVFLGKEEQRDGEDQKEGEERLEREAAYVATLSKCPHDLHVLWNKYEFGIGRRKAAKDFSS